MSFGPTRPQHTPRSFKALQSGMYPHPVYVQTGEIRERAALSRRRALHADL